MIRLRLFAGLRILGVTAMLFCGLGLVVVPLSSAFAQGANASTAQNKQDPKKDPKKTKKPSKTSKTSKTKPTIKGKTTTKATTKATTKGKAVVNGKPASTPVASKAPDPAKPHHIQTFGTWGVFATSAKAKTCYILAQPKERLPTGLKRDAGYVFISTRPAENVRNELSFTVGYEVKADAKPEPKLELGPESFPLVANGSNLWLKNAADNAAVLDKLRRGSKMVVKASSQRGNQTSDLYPLIGLAQALDRLGKECP